MWKPEHRQAARRKGQRRAEGLLGADPMQQRLMRWMPWLFMIVLAQSSVGLVIYWSFSSIFTMGQQYVLMRRFKVENPVDEFFARLTSPKEPKASKAP